MHTMYVDGRQCFHRIQRVHCSYCMQRTHCTHCPQCSHCVHCIQRIKAARSVAVDSRIHIYTYIYIHSLYIYTYMCLDTSELIVRYLGLHAYSKYYVNWRYKSPQVSEHNQMPSFGSHLHSRSPDEDPRHYMLSERWPSGIHSFDISDSPAELLVQHCVLAPKARI